HKDTCIAARQLPDGRQAICRLVVLAGPAVFHHIYIKMCAAIVFQVCEAFASVVGMARFVVLATGYQQGTAIDDLRAVIVVGVVQIITQFLWILLPFERKRNGVAAVGSRREV